MGLGVERITLLYGKGKSTQSHLLQFILVNENNIEEIEAEKIIFKFIEKKINVEHFEYKIKEKSDIIHIKNIKIKNIGEKEYDLSLFNWSKNENSDKDINFYQKSMNEKFKNELHFTSTETCKSEEEKDNLDLDLIIDNPKIGNKYTIYISIINIIKKEVLSEEPLEVSVEIKINEKLKIENVLNIIKNLKYLKLLTQNEIIDTIKNNISLADNKIKKIIEENIEEMKILKINELLEKLDEEFQFTNFLDKETVKTIILQYDFDEDKIKKWIESKEKENREIENNYIYEENLTEARIQEIYDEIESIYITSAFLSKEQVLAKIVGLKGNIEYIKDWVEDMM